MTTIEISIDPRLIGIAVAVVSILVALAAVVVRNARTERDLEAQQEEARREARVDQAEALRVSRRTLPPNEHARQLVLRGKGDV